MLNNTFINDLSNELKNNIKTVSKKTVSRSGVSTIVTTNERLFALSLIELNDDRNDSLEETPMRIIKLTI